MPTDIEVSSSNALSEALSLGSFILEDLSLSEITDLIYSWCFDHLSHDSIVNAQQEFQHLTGKFFSDDDFYKVRIKYFIEYFLFDRLEKFDFLNHLTCPIYAFYQSQLFRTLPKNALHFILELRNSHHSLFQVDYVNSDSLQITDLLAPHRQKISIAASKNQVFAGIEKSDIFQCHIFKIDHINCISDGLILHSRKARKTLLELANEYNNNNKLTQLQYLFQLANGQLMMVRRQSVSAMYAYQYLK